MIRALLVVVLLAAAGWSGYWFVGSRSLDSGVEDWFDDRRAEGWVAEAGDIRVRGFPNRFDLIVSEPQLADPETGWAWSAPFFQALMLSYRPSHMIAVWPDEQTIASPLQRIEVASADMRASLRLADTRTLSLEDATFVSEDVSLASDLGWTAHLDTGRLAARHIPVAEDTYEIGIEALGLTPADAVRDRVDRTGALPDEIETLRLDAEIAFDRPWDRAAIELARPQPTAIDLRELRATWGRLDLRATGAVTVDPEGVPEGQIAIKAANWREMLELAVASGAVPGPLASGIETGLEFIAGQSGSPDTLDATLTLRNGRISYGIIPLGPAPRLILR